MRWLLIRPSSMYSPWCWKSEWALAWRERRRSSNEGLYIIFPAGATHALQCLEDASLVLFK